MLDSDREAQRTIALQKQMQEDDKLRRQMRDDEQLRRDRQESELLRSAEKTRKLTEPIEKLADSLKLTDSLKPLQDAMRVSPNLTDIIRGPGTDMLRHKLPAVRTLDERFQEMIHAQAEAAEASTARRAVLRLEEQIREFEAELDDDSEGVGIQLVSFGQKMIVHIQTINHIQPNLIVFTGRLDETGAPVRLIQHMSQLSFLLLSLRRLEPEEPRRPIGFITSEEAPAE